MNTYYLFPLMCEELTSRVIADLDIFDIHSAYIADELVDYLMDQPTDCGKTLRDNLFDIACLMNTLPNSNEEFSIRRLVAIVGHSALVEHLEIEL